MSFYTDDLIYLAHPRTGSVAKNHHAGLDEIPNRGQRVITTIRNPVECMRSWWSLIPNDLTFSQFIQSATHSHLERNGHLFYFYKDAGGDVMRFENLEADLNGILGTGNRVKIPRMNVTKAKKEINEHWDTYTQALWKRFPWEMSLYWRNYGK